MRRAAWPFAFVALVAVVALGGPAWAHPRTALNASPASAPASVASAPAAAAPVASGPAATSASVAPAPIAAASLEILSPATPESPLPWVALLLVGAVGVAALSRQRRAVAITLVAVVALLAFETGVHSTHHLDKPDDAAHCTVASMSAQLSADLVDVALDAPALAPQAIVPILAAPLLAKRPLAPDAGRAPPALSV